MPYYRGGEEAIKKFVIDNLKYPKDALEQKVEGEVEASYDVDGLGRTRKIKIISGLGYGCDEEVIRLIGLLKYEKAFNKGRNVTLHRKLKVNFKLPAIKKSVNQKISYQVVKAKSKEKEPPKEAPKKITYTINLNS